MPAADVFDHSVRALRHERDWSQSNLAHHAGVAVNVVRRVESAEEWSDVEPMQLGSLRAVAEALEVGVAEMFGASEL